MQSVKAAQQSEDDIPSRRVQSGSRYDMGIHVKIVPLRKRTAML